MPTSHAHAATANTSVVAAHSTSRTSVLRHSSAASSTGSDSRPSLADARLNACCSGAAAPSGAIREDGVRDSGPEFRDKDGCREAPSPDNRLLRRCGAGEASYGWAASAWLAPVKSTRATTGVGVSTASIAFDTLATLPAALRCANQASSRAYLRGATHGQRL